jgi:hypothetical protein
MIRAASIAAVVLAAVTLTAAGAAMAPIAAQTMRLTGRVVSDDAGSAPVRRARVVLHCADSGAAATVVTGDDGRFVFAGLKAGRCTLTAAKPGFVTIEHGAMRPGRSGTPIAIGTEPTPEITLRLPRGGVITGLVRDRAGLPQSGVSMAVYRKVFRDGDRVLAPVSVVRADRQAPLTDDEGRYRLYGLAPGDYVVAANVERRSSDAIRDITADDIRRALTLLASPTQAMRASSLPATAVAATPPTRYAPVYYPGTVSLSDAGPIHVEPGDVRDGIDIFLQLVATARIEGTLTGIRPDVPQNRVSVYLQTIGSPIYESTSASVSANGRFVAPAVRPGRYLLVAHARSASAGEAGADIERWWTQQELTVSGADVTGLTLALQPTRSIELRMTTSNEAAIPLPAALHATLHPIPFDQSRLSGTRITGPSSSLGTVAPGRYLLTVSGFDAERRSDRRWVVTRAIYDGEDISNRAFEIGPAGPQTIDVHLSDRPASISGTLQTPAGRPVTSVWILAFSTNPNHWVWQSRRIHAVRPATDGSFLVDGLPAGDYHLAAVTDLDDNEWFDPDMLRPLVPQSLRLTLAESERWVQHLKVNR